MVVVAVVVAFIAPRMLRILVKLVSIGYADAVYFCKVIPVTVITFSSFWSTETFIPYEPPSILL